MKTVTFWKMSGAGNDFVVLDNRRGQVSGSAAAWAKRLCDRHEGVGGDGLLLLENAKAPSDFRMVYYNADGSRASMCGNGARCIAWFAREQGVVDSVFQFDTDAGRVSGRFEKGVIEIGIRDPKDYRPTLSLPVKGKTHKVSLINTGVPHVVDFVPNVNAVDVQGLGRALRFHRGVGPAGANVNFVQRVNAHTLKVRTYERGVEGETLACGTGVIASAIAAGLRGLAKSPVRCIVRGGDTLTVRFELREDAQRPASQVFLRGPVRPVFKGDIHV